MCCSESVPEDEGAEVKKGEMLIELYSSRLSDQIIDQQIQLKTAEDLCVNARENVAVVEKERRSLSSRRQNLKRSRIRDSNSSAVTV
jgi:hypothetical protein